MTVGTKTELRLPLKCWFALLYNISVFRFYRLKGSGFGMCIYSIHSILDKKLCLPVSYGQDQNCGFMKWKI